MDRKGFFRNILLELVSVSVEIKVVAGNPVCVGHHREHRGAASIPAGLCFLRHGSHEVDNAPGSVRAERRDATSDLGREVNHQVSGRQG